MDPRSEMRELQRLYEEGGYSDDFSRLLRSSKWGDRIRDDVIEALKRHEAEAIEDGISFLDESPRYFQSGYRKCSIASKLKSAPLTAEQQRRLLDIILRAATSNRVGPEFSEYARLAAILATRTFVDDVVRLNATVGGWQRERVERLLRHCRRTTLRKG